MNNEIAKTVAPRIPWSLWIAVRELAKSDQRSTTAEVCVLLQEAITARKAQAAHERMLEQRV